MVIIKNMDMPSCCGKCRLRIADYLSFAHRCAITWEYICAKDDYKSLEVKLKDCPLKEVKE